MCGCIFICQLSMATADHAAEEMDACIPRGNSHMQPNSDDDRVVGTWDRLTRDDSAAFEMSGWSAIIRSSIGASLSVCPASSLRPSGLPVRPWTPFTAISLACSNAARVSSVAELGHSKKSVAMPRLTSGRVSARKPNSSSISAITQCDLRSLSGVGRVYQLSTAQRLCVDLAWCRNVVFADPARRQRPLELFRKLVLLRKVCCAQHAEHGAPRVSLVQAAYTAASMHTIAFARRLSASRPTGDELSSLISILCTAG